MTQISIQENIIIKTYYNNVQNKLQEKYANWFIKLIKKIFQKLHFQEIPNEFIKNNFELMISIYLFTKRFQFISNKWFDSILFVFTSEKSYLHSFYKKKLLQKSQFDNKNIFLLLLKKKRKEKKFYNFICKSISIWFYSRNVIFTNFKEKYFLNKFIYKVHFNLILFTDY